MLATETIEAGHLIELGLGALRSGDAVEARGYFQRVAVAGGSVPWLALARACNMLGDSAGEEDALQRQLEGDKRSLPALLAMGELKARQRDDRAASSFFRAALNTAAAAPYPPQLQPLLQRAQSFVSDSGSRFEAHLTERLREAGLAGGSLSPRMAHAIDLLLGRVPLYLQQPNMFYFPGLPQRAFYEREEFAWLAGIEAAVPAMQAELAGLLADDSNFSPFVVQMPNLPPSANPLLNDPRWGVFHLWQRGRRIEEHAPRVPATMAALELAPMPFIPNSAPMALFSVLRPHTHIVPHHGIVNTRLICHVPLLVPEECRFRVGAEVRRWRLGETLIFDDSIEHEAWNDSDRTRVVLLFEIWRPEITESERRELTTLFEAIELLPPGEE